MEPNANRAASSAQKIFAEMDDCDRVQCKAHKDFNRGKIRTTQGRPTRGLRRIRGKDPESKPAWCCCTKNPRENACLGHQITLRRMPPPRRPGHLTKAEALRAIEKSPLRFTHSWEQVKEETRE
jgi:hypothetical protein